jgi:Flp pilus assembly protein TadB
MQERLKNYALVICLFVFLFVILGGGLHLNPSGAFLAAATGTPLAIYVFHRKSEKAFRQENVLPDTARKEVAYVSSKTSRSD